MGCGASLPKECTPDQKAILCAAMGKEMMRICVKPTMEASESIQIPAPPQVANLRNDVANWRHAAKEGKQNIQDAGKAAPSDSAPDDGQKKATGMVSGLMNAASGVAAKAAEAVAGGAAVAVEMTLNGMADQLEKLIDTIEAPFTKIGQEIMEKQKGKIQAVFEAYIGNLALKATNQSVELVRGDAPHGLDEYAKVTDALADYLCRKSGKNLFNQLHPLSQEAIKEHTITKTWNTAIESYNSLCKTIGGNELAKKNNLVPKPIELDIDEYIAEQCIEQLAKIMGAKEQEIRKNPTSVSANCKNPKTFVTVFSGVMLTDKILDLFQTGKDTAPP